MTIKDAFSYRENGKNAHILTNGLTIIDVNRAKFNLLSSSNKISGNSKEVPTSILPYNLLKWRQQIVLIEPMLNLSFDPPVH